MNRLFVALRLAKERAVNLMVFNAIVTQWKTDEWQEMLALPVHRCTSFKHSRNIHRVDCFDIFNVLEHM